jgi:hypothetical protein
VTACHLKDRCYIYCRSRKFSLFTSLSISISVHPALHLVCQLLHQPEHETNHSPPLVPALRKEVPWIDCLHLSIEHSRPLQFSSQSVHSTVANDNHSIKFYSDKRFGLVDIAQRWLKTITTVSTKCKFSSAVMSDNQGTSFASSMYA